MRTQVAIIGAGPAGMFLAHLLHAAGIDTVVLERRDRLYAESRVRAGVLERTTTDLLVRLGLGERMLREGIVHTGTWLASDGDTFRIDMAALTGSSVTVYGQQEVMRDLFEGAEARGLDMIWHASDLALHDIAGQPHVTWQADDTQHRLDCDFIAGCDGFHGACRACLPEAALRVFERVYPFGWLGILAEVPPACDELVYANHERGFALASMRSPSRSRYYLQCAADENITAWPDERFWDELSIRLGPDVSRTLIRGPSFEKSVAPLRSFVAEPMRHGNLFLAGDAAHIVPPTGAKGMNLAVSDVIMLAEGFHAYYLDGTSSILNAYSDRALARVWNAERFSWWFTGLTHRFPDTTPFDRRMQLAELAYLRSSRAAQTVLAENYVGLPIA